MKNVFVKYETFFCILLIVTYLIVNSYCIQNFGMMSYKSVIVNTAFSFLLMLLMLALKRITYYGIARVTNIKKYLYFIPLGLIIMTNFLGGINVKNTFSDIIFYILLMINIGFIEEIIFRGFLFKMMEKSNVKSAIIVNAISFGAGHIVNLFNGALLIPTLFQIGCAVSIGFLFVIIFYKSKSLIPCIVTHGLINALSIFSVENSFSLYLAPMFLIIISSIYAIYINKTVS